MILSPTSSENKTILLIPWDDYRTSLILRTTVCFTIAVLTCLGSIALMSYAIINGNWLFFGMSLGIILLLISVALILDLPVKNKFFGTTLTNEISQDISNVGVESIEKFRVAFANIRNTFIPNMRDLHNKLLNDYQTVISKKEDQIRNLSSSLDSLVRNKQQELSSWIERNPNAYQTQILREQLNRWNSYEQKGIPVRNRIPSC
ncbi:hypothetical protein [Chlamydia buteonis]|uniref:Inner membrane protein n=1 Tax=Chlamydia buteonis TaxID=2494525 RepID=A0ABX8L975_9CHLA|nr:hypothetical protein [Chlamydia buteonis]QXE27231.1 hypothetical protein HBN95_03745 [Chlamydia buteonis]QXE27855.1 hypothetical protein JJJ19_04455 [Chlamydia buteonis]